MAQPGQIVGQRERRRDGRRGRHREGAAGRAVPISRLNLDEYNLLTVHS
ncbi:hypothetical protein [Bordetella pertussis]|nr:hypothetical protein [Bordetella pertussis]ETH07785.1 hypothetical protein L571_1853 [Bordetella pertussis 2371640]